MAVVFIRDNRAQRFADGANLCDILRASQTQRGLYENKQTVVACYAAVHIYHFCPIHCACSRNLRRASASRCPRQNARWRFTCLRHLSPKGGRQVSRAADSHGYVAIHQDTRGRFDSDQARGRAIARARYRNSTEKAEPIEPHKIYKYNIDLCATSNVFKAGHRLRVYLSSNNFPRFNRNLNTGEKTFGGTRMEKAKQTIYHDAEHPSAIVLPIMPRK